MLKFISPTSFLLLTVVLATMLLMTIPAFGVATELGNAASASFSLQPAQARYAAGDRQGALSELRYYILSYPDSPELVEAHTLMARILIEEQRYGDALIYLNRLGAQQQNSLSKLLMVTALQQQGNWLNSAVERQQLSQVEEIMSQLNKEMFVGADRQLYDCCRATQLVWQKQPLQALIVLRGALDAHTEETMDSSVFNQIGLILRGLTPDELAEAKFMFAATPLNDAIVIFSARQALNGGDMKTAQKLTEELIETTHRREVRINCAQLLDQIYGQPWQRRAIGVILPMTGRYAPFAKLVRQGIELAAEQHHAQDLFVFVDSYADKERGAQAMRDLIEGHRVMAIIGPLTGSVAWSVADIADHAQVPLLTLSHRGDLPSRGRYIFRNCLTVEQQVQALAEYAIEVLGLNTYAILSPDSDDGTDFAAKFSAAIESRGGDIEHWQQFADQDTDFRRQLLLLKGEDPDAPPEEEQEKLNNEVERELDEFGEEIPALPVEELPDWLPNVDFEALFVPAYADVIAMLAPQLAFYDIKNVQLLGINGWNAPQLFQQAGRYTKGAIFSDGFYLGSDDPVVVDFIRRYQQHYGDKPSILEAQAYDCANIMFQVMTQPEVNSSEAVTDALNMLDGFHGVTGVYGFDANGEALRKVVLLQMGRRNLHQLDSVESVSTQESLNAAEKFQLHLPQVFE